MDWQWWYLSVPDGYHYINITFSTGWHGRLLLRGNIVDWGYTINFIIPTVKNPDLFNFLINSFTHQATISLNVTRCNDVAKYAATAAIGFSNRTVHTYISRGQQFLNVTLPTIALVKTVWHSKNVARSIDRSDHRKLTQGIIIENVQNRCMC